jgi:NADH:ubiquinone oxidoreductase subunit H
VRGRQPRIRYDILIYLTWKCFLPIILVVPIILLVISSIMN